MQVAVIVLAVVALVFAIAWLSARRSLGRLNTELDATSQSLATTRGELSKAQRDHAERVGEFEDAATAKQRELEESRSDLTTASNRVTALESDVKTANDTVRARDDALLEAETSRDEAVGRADDLHDQVVALIDDRDALRGEMERAKEQPSLVLGDASTNGDHAHINTLWQLELARSERTWAHSVAVNPESDESPFQTSADLIRTAVEVEASALREEVGAFITIDWQADPIDDAARRHLLLRVAQEVLAAAAREPAASTLRVSGSDDVTLELFATDDDQQVINLIAPTIDHELVDVTTAHGLTITVRAS